MVSPKEARRRQQLLARERKRSKARRSAEKKLARKAPGFDGVLDRWLNLAPSAEPQYERCPGCSKLVMLEWRDDGMLIHHHEPPRCAAYEAFARATDTDDGPHDDEVGISMDEVMQRMVPAWTQGPCTEITEEEGDELLDSGDVIESSMMLGGGMIESVMYARTAKGLFRWSVASMDDDDDDDFDDEDK